MQCTERDPAGQKRGGRAAGRVLKEPIGGLEANFRRPSAPNDIESAVVG